MRRKGRLLARGSQSVRQRFALRSFVIIFSLVAFVSGGIVFLLSLSDSKKAYADTCGTTYSLDWGNPATYTITCGTINSGNWTVKGDTCQYFSPVLYVGGIAGDPSKTINLNVRVNQSGNLTNNDFAWDYVFINGALSQTYAARGDTGSSVFNTAISVTVPAGGNFQISVKVKSDKANEFWQIKNGEITACIVNPPSPLPVTLTSFNGTLTDKHARLKWTTAAEVENDHFAVERSSDAENYEEIGRLQGYGTTSVRHDYTFTDEQTPTGITYYRLSQTDYDGTVKYYGPIAIRKNDADAQDIRPVVYPNPFSENFTYTFSASSDETTELILADVRGSVQESFPVQIKRGLNNIRIRPTIDLRPGTYLVGVKAGSQLNGFTRIVRK